jgi:AcrB/AcrD/AcrF family
VRVAQVLRWLISFGLRKSSHAFVAAVCLLIFGVVRNKPLDVIPEFSPLSLTVKTESLGLSSAEAQSLITVPLEADALNGVPSLQIIQSRSMAGLQIHHQLPITPARTFSKASLTGTATRDVAHVLEGHQTPSSATLPMRKKGLWRLSSSQNNTFNRVRPCFGG